MEITITNYYACAICASHHEVTDLIHNSLFLQVFAGTILSASKRFADFVKQVYSMEVIFFCCCNLWEMGTVRTVAPPAPVCYFWSLYVPRYFWIAKEKTKEQIQALSPDYPQG